MAKKQAVKEDFPIVNEGNVPLAGTVETADEEEVSIDPADKNLRCRCGANRFQVVEIYEVYQTPDGDYKYMQVDEIAACMCGSRYSLQDGSADKQFVEQGKH